MDIIKELDENQIELLVVSSTNYNEVVVDVVKQLSKGSVAYVTLNKTYSALDEIFKKKGVATENIVYIDTITKTIRNVPDQDDRCYYVSSPGALTEMSLAIGKLLNHGFDYLIFDSLTNLLIYEQRSPVAKFVQSIINKVRDSKTKAVFYVLSLKEQDELIQETGMFVDKVLDLSERPNVPKV
jgi:archaellum biogenesis ATPase FlaH